MKTLRFLAVAAAAVLAIPAAAQQAHAHGGGCMHGMGAAGHFAPAMLLHHRADIALTADQVARLEAMQEAAKSRHQAMRHPAPAAGPTDEAAYTAALDARLQAHREMMLASFRASRDARALLTAEQLRKLDEHHARMQSGGHGAAGHAHAAGGHGGDHANHASAGHGGGEHAAHASGAHAAAGLGDAQAGGEADCCCDDGCCGECCCGDGCDMHPTARSTED